jgi:hypothetical protein
MSKESFTKSVERLIDPISVGTLHFMQSFNQLLPKPLQKSIVTASSKKTPYMGFVVEPYSLFLCHEIIDLERAKTLLPDGFELVKTRIFTDDEPKYYCIFGCVRAHTSAFWGCRTEFYIIAEDQATGLLSWVIIDYVTDTISYDSKNGLTSPNGARSVIATDYRGTILIDIQTKSGANKLALEADVTNGKMTGLDQRLWLEGNLSIGYGRNLSDDGADIFGLKFDPGEVEKALKIPSSALRREANTWYSGLFAPEPAQVVCFPYAQHFISDSPGHSSGVKDRAGLEKSVAAINFNDIKVFSTKSFKLAMLISAAVSLTIMVVLVLLLLLQTRSE